MTTEHSLTILFDDPFWIGLFEARKQTQNTGIGTKSQQALKLQQEENKKERKTLSKEQLKAEKERKFELKQAKRKEKHRGH